MCCTSIHLLIGALLVFAIENVATARENSTENNTAPVSVPSYTTTQFKETEFTIPNVTVTLPNKTAVNTTSASELPTPPPPERPQTNNFTTGDSLKTIAQSSTINMIKSTTISKATITTAVKTTVSTTTQSGTKTFIVIFIIAILCLAGVLVYCCLKKKSRKYSVDLHPKHEDAQIPLSTVDAEVFDTTSVKDMQTFTPVESTEPLKDPAPESEKPEGEKESADVKQENQQNLSSTQATENPKDKMEGLTVVDLTDGEPTISTKTSMESLDDVLNENNSNNTRVKGNGHDFTEISIDALLLK